MEALSFDEKELKSQKLEPQEMASQEAATSQEVSSQEVISQEPLHTITNLLSKIHIDKSSNGEILIRTQGDSAKILAGVLKTLGTLLEQAAPDASSSSQSLQNGTTLQYGEYKILSNGEVWPCRLRT